MPSCSRNCWLFSQVIGWERTWWFWQPWPSLWPSKSSFYEILEHPKHFHCRLLLALDLCPEWVFLHTFSWKTSLDATCHQHYTRFLLENILGCYISSVLYTPSPWRLPWMLRIKTHFDLLVVKSPSSVKCFLLSTCPNSWTFYLSNHFSVFFIRVVFKKERDSSNPDLHILQPHIRVSVTVEATWWENEWINKW